MKSLIIARHGKSDWENDDLADIDRPLKNRGVNDTYVMAKRLNDMQTFPDLIISSPATRAIATALILARGMEIQESHIKINNTIYFSDEEKILEEIKVTDNSINKLMIVGHNPVFTNLANMFLTSRIENLPTSGIAILNFDTTEWGEICRNKVVSESVIFPKKY